MAPEPAPPPTFDKFWPKTRRGLSSMVWKKNQDPNKIMLYSPKKRTSRRQIQGYFQNPGNLPFQPKLLKPTPEVPFLILPVPIRLLIFDDLSPFVFKNKAKRFAKQLLSDVINALASVNCVYSYQNRMVEEQRIIPLPCKKGNLFCFQSHHEK